MCRYEGCDKTFPTAHKLKVHERRHQTENKPYKCEMEGCGKVFSANGTLTAHMKIHSGERPHACPVDGCEKRFTKASKLKLHLRSHTGERPFHCEVQVWLSFVYSRTSFYCMSHFTVVYKWVLSYVYFRYPVPLNVALSCLTVIVSCRHLIHFTVSFLFRDVAGLSQVLINLSGICGNTRERDHLCASMKAALNHSQDQVI